VLVIRNFCVSSGLIFSNALFIVNCLCLRWKHVVIQCFCRLSHL
jgi:hypothetical protein